MLAMHEAGAPHPSFTHSHTDEWQEIENAPCGVGMAQFELRNPRVRFVSESAMWSIFCHSLKLTLSRQGSEGAERQG